VPLADGVGSVVLERVLDMLAILLLGALFGFLALRTQLPGWILITYVVGVVLLLSFGALLLLLPALFAPLRRISAHPLWQRVVDFAAQMVTSLRTLPHRPGVALLVVLESLYIWLCDALLLWLVMRSLGQFVPFGQAAFVALTVDALAAIPLTPGGVGQIEATYAALLALLALPMANISAAILLTRAISYWSFLLFSGFVSIAIGIGALRTERIQAIAEIQADAPAEMARSATGTPPAKLTLHQ